MSEYSRFINIRVTVDIWDWDTGSIVETRDITDDCKSYQFQTTIKSPKGTATVQVVPQSNGKNILDSMSPMDVVKIYEFDVLKFQGYINNIGYSGSISQDGKPNRSGTLSITHMGGLLVDAATGMGLGTALGDPDNELYLETVDLSVNIANAVHDNANYKDIIILLIENILSYIQGLGGTRIGNYLEEYIFYGTGLMDDITSVIPRSFELYTGTEQSITFWTIIEKLIEKPFYELFMTDGPRNVSIGGVETTLSEGTHIVFRPTPFDGTVGSGSTTAFQDISPIKIAKDYFLGFNLNKGMAEAYSVYSVKNAAFELSDLARQLLGRYDIDNTRLNKYAFRPMIVEQLFTREEKTDDTEADVSVADIENNADNLTATLMAWFEHNDEYLSGSISMMVPSDAKADPRIGDKIELEGITGNFYVEGVAHQWNYGGALKSNLSVTRGYNNTQPIKLSDNTLFYRRQV